MSIYLRLKEDIKNAMKAKANCLMTLRGLDAAIQLKAKNDLVPIVDSLVLDVIEKAIKQRKESIEQFDKGNRPELAEKEQIELNILLAYLPEQLSIRELDVMISRAMYDVGLSKGAMILSIKDMGAVNKIIMPQIKGRADSKTVSNMVKDILSK